MIDGYGKHGAPSERTIGVVLNSAPGSITVLTREAGLFVSRKSARSDPTTIVFVIRPSESVLTVRLTIALLPRGRFPRLQNSTPFGRMTPPCETEIVWSCAF